MSDRMNVNLVVENYIPGGLERFVFDLINGLDSERYQVNLLCNSIPGLDERLKWNVHRPLNFLPYSNLTTARLGACLTASRRTRWQTALMRAIRFSAWWPLLASSILNMRRLLQTCLPGVVHIINGGYPGAQGCLAAAIAAQRLKCPRIILSVQSYPFPRRFWFDKLVDRWIAQAVNVIVPNSLTAGQALINLRGFPAYKVSTIQTGTLPPPYDPAASAQLRAELNLPRDSILVGTVAALEPMKGHRVLLEAIQHIHPEFPQVKFVFLGEGTARAALEAYIRTHALESVVRLAGHRHDAQRLTNAFDLIAFPSLYEGLPIAILEAMALAKPIVATAVGGIPEEIDHGRSGLLVAPGDSQALADGLRQLLQSPARTAQMGRAAQGKYYRQFTLEHMVEAFTGLYAQVEL